MPPNILLIMTDDQRRTPDGAGNALTDLMPQTMAEFADRGTDFTNFHISSPVCGPSRATLYSGLYASQHGVWSVLNGETAWPSFYHFCRLLRANGYETGIVGKYTNWIDPGDGDPLTHHFDFAWDYSSENPTDPDEAADLLSNANTFITGADPGPWFLAVCPHIPHDPYSVTPVVTPSYPTFTDPTAAFESNTAEKVAPHSVSAGTRADAEDHFVGQMEEVAALDEIIDNLFSNFDATERDAMVCIFTSDNGFMWGEHGYLDKELPYRESTNVNFFISGPDLGIPEGATDTRLCSNIDIAPTILDIANITADYEMPGRSLLLSADGHPDFIYIEAPRGDNAGTPPGSGNAWRGIREIDKLYVEWTDAGEYEHYDTDTDPTEVAGSSTSIGAYQTLLNSLPYQEAGLMSPLTDPTTSRILTIDPVVPQYGADFWVELAGPTGGDDLTGNLRPSAAADGAVMGDSTDAPPGIVGSTSFDGVSGRVFVADNEGNYGPDEDAGYRPLGVDSTPPGIHTFLVWSKRASTGADAPLIVVQSYSLRWSSTTSDIIGVRQGLTTDNFDLNNTYVDEWVLFGWVLNFDNDTTTLWVNGSLIGSANISDNQASQFGMVIGGAPTTSPRFHGKIARVAYYNRRLEAAEHMTHYELGINQMNRRDELVLDDNVRVDGIDWGDSAIEQHLANHKIGSSAVDWRMPNRQILVPINLRDGQNGRTWQESRDQLQAKVSILREEGGVIRRGPSERALYADIVNATLTLPDSWHAEHRDSDPEVTLTLEASPDFYGHEDYLGKTVGANGRTVVALSEVDGQYPGRVRAIGGTFSANKHALLYAMRSRYSGGTLDPMVYTIPDPAITTAGSATTTSDYIQDTSIPSLTTVRQMATLNGMAHVGPHRVYADVASNGGTTSWQTRLQLHWATGFDSQAQENEPVDFEMGLSFQRRLVDLGTIYPRKAKMGPQNWTGKLYVGASNTGVSVRVHGFYILPVSEAQGRVFPRNLVQVATAGGQIQLGNEGYWTQGGTATTRMRPQVVEGTLPRLPATTEGRDVQWMFRFTEGTANIAYGPKEMPNTGSSSPDIHVYHRPSYLFPIR